MTSRQCARARTTQPTIRIQQRMLDAVQDSIFKVKINLVSSSPALQQEGIESLREILAIDNPLIPTLVIDLGIFPPLINILTETNDSATQTKILSILNDLPIKIISKTGLLPVILWIARSTNTDIATQALALLARVGAEEDVALKSLLLRLGIVQTLHIVHKHHRDNPILQELIAGVTLGLLLHSDDVLLLATKDALPFLHTFLFSSAEFALKNTCFTLQHVVKLPALAAKVMTGEGVPARLVALLSEDCTQELKSSLLQLIGTIAGHRDSYKELFVALEVFPILQRILSKSRENYVLGCFLLATLLDCSDAAKKKLWIEEAWKIGLLEYVATALDEHNYRARAGALRVLMIAVSAPALPTLIAEVVNWGTLTSLCDILQECNFWQRKDQRLAAAVLGIMAAILQYCRVSRPAIAGAVLNEIIHRQVIDTVQRLKDFNVSQIAKLADEVIDLYLSIADEEKPSQLVSQLRRSVSAVIHSLGPQKHSCLKRK